jgi:hypothetical protein
MADGPVNIFTGNSTTLCLGQRGGNTRYLKSGLDEPRMSNVARTGDWITAEYNNQSNPGTFYSVGPQAVVDPPTQVSIAVTPANPSSPRG